jgi:hypothetical protein
MFASASWLDRESGGKTAKLKDSLNGPVTAADVRLVLPASSGAGEKGSAVQSDTHGPRHRVERLLTDLKTRRRLPG